ncbi:MAG: response regulator transcription factor [Cyclobacteriaceae bacterium]|nr:response regulator transcription factor [Cyclobacteriaceae bacterium]
MVTAKQITIVLVDDHQIVLDGLVSLLSSDPSFQVMAALGTGEDVIRFMTKVQPDILLTDYSLPGISGLDLCRQVKRKYPAVKVVALSMHDEVHLVRTIMKEGVDGYLLKNIQQIELKNALRQVMMGHAYVSPEITRMMMSDIHQPDREPALLSERELEVLRLITQEFSNKQIADKLFISERTVETHRKNIFRKTHTSSIVGLIKFAFEKKLV